MFPRPATSMVALRNLAVSFIRPPPPAASRPPPTAPSGGCSTGTPPGEQGAALPGGNDADGVANGEWLSVDERARLPGGRIVLKPDAAHGFPLVRLPEIRQRRAVITRSMGDGRERGDTRGRRQ